MNGTGESLVGRLRSWLAGTPAPPYRLELRPTNRCNLLCKPCWIRAYDRNRFDYKNELSPKEILRIIQEAAELGVRHIELVGGGEPTIDPEAALEYVVAVKKLGMFGDLTTNGTRFTPAMARRMVEIGWDHIMFSINAPDAPTDDMIRGVPGAFEKSIGAIQAFVSAKRAAGTDAPVLGITPILTRHVIARTSDFIELAHSLGVQKVVFKPMYAHSEDARQLLPSAGEKQQFYRSIPRAIALARKYGMGTNLNEIADETHAVEQSDAIDTVYSRPEPEEVSTESASPRPSLAAPCFQPWFYVAVDAEGYVIPCAGAGLCKDENIRGRKLSDIWWGPTFSQFRERVMSGELPIHCRDCCGGIYLDNQRVREQLGEARDDG